MAEPAHYKVFVGWDEENGVFFVLESDIKGLWLEAATMDALTEKILDVAPELLTHNHRVEPSGMIETFQRIGVPVALGARTDTRPRAP